MDYADMYMMNPTNGVFDEFEIKEKNNGDILLHKMM